MDAVLDYPTWYALIPAFQSPAGNLSALITVVKQSQELYASGAFLTGSFLDNYDQARFKSLTSDAAVSLKVVSGRKTEHYCNIACG
jgi:alpha-amylase